ncbi:MAG: hypothetical protein WC869_05915 [Phycisphaerae bacterium]|jgi:excinuclease UvrABC nuclease subunit
MADWKAQFDGELAVAPPMDEEQLALVPARRGVFLLLAEGGEPLILTTAADIRSRLRSRLTAPDPGQGRKKTADLRAITARILWKLTDSHFETDWRYLELARTIWPSAFARLIPWKGGWFVHVDPSARFPHFEKTNDASTAGGRCVGPFPSGRAAQRFIDSLADAFDLCRDSRCLARAPHGQPCPYLQMGKCLGACNGTISMEEYRAVIAAAADFAAGRREAFREQLTSRMKGAAGELAFEKAAALKARIGRLSEFDAQAYEQAAPLEDFRFVCIQRGPSRKAAKAFWVSGGGIVEAGTVGFPLVGQPLQELLDRMKQLACSALGPPKAERWTVSLAASYLFSSPQRRGLLLRWRADMDVAELAGAIEKSADMLAIKAAPPRRTKIVNESPPGPEGGV